MIEKKPIRNFEDLPKEWQNVDFLRAQYRQSILLTAIFTGTATASWIYNGKIHAEIKANPAPDHKVEQTAMGLTTIGTTGFAVIGVLATLKLRKFLRQGNALKDKSDTPPAP